jgi:hypothetical protein
MTVRAFVVSLADLLRALIAECRFRYYRLAYRHCGERHPDGALIARRMVQAQLQVGDILRRYVK